ncbi:Rv1476 family membrane protein [Nocardia paucivorans]|uniref:Rv1476 family membrane protein n=1 Tax=Nocardia paucivorans TaxID=114259 RepID=UPI0002D48940|nr:DUF6676 family protein [Nocardia paucivorans]
MTVSYTRVFVPQIAGLPQNIDLDELRADLADNHVAAPSGVDQDDVAAIVAQARAKGIKLSVVVTEGNPWHDSELRDLATEVAKTEHGTILVLSRDWAGTYSDTFSRVKLEAAEDAVEWVRPVEAIDTKTQTFVDRIEHEPMIDWTHITIILLVGMVLAIGGLYRVKSRRAERTDEVPQKIS